MFYNTISQAQNVLLLKSAELHWKMSSVFLQLQIFSNSIFGVIQCPFALFNQILVQGVEDFINKKIFTNTPKCIAKLNADFQYIWPILLIIKFINNKPRSVALIFRCTVCLLLAINLSFAWEKRLRDWF